MNKNLKRGSILILLGGIVTLSIIGCKKADNLVEEKISTKERSSSNLPNNFIEVKTFYAKILGVDSAMINYNEAKKSFFIKNTKVEESFKLINESYLINKKHNLK